MLSNDDRADAISGHRGYRPEIDGLRCIAVALVVGFHLAPNAVPNGFVGVDSFFAVSGYVVTQSIASRGASSFGADLLAFYARRVQRLLPALLACIAATAVGFALIAPPVSSTAAGFRTGLSALVGFSNWHLIGERADYFGADLSLDPFGHTWSLGIEEQFYVAYAPLLLLAIRSSARIRAALPMMLLAAAGASLAWFLRRDGSIEGYYATTGKAWEMLLGVASFWAVERLPACLAAARPAAAAAGLLSVLGSAFLPASAAVASAIAVGGTLLMLLGSGSPTARILRSAPLRWVGLRSYGIYLWHWPIAVLCIRAAGDAPWTAYAVILVSVGAAAASYRWLEMPIRSLRVADSRAAASRIVAGAAGIGATALFVSACGWWLNPVASLTADAAPFLERAPSAPTDDGGGGPPAFELIVVGDSHAQMLFPALRACAETAAFRIVNRTGTGMLVSETLALDRADRDYGSRRTLVRRAFDEAAEAGSPPRAVFVACRFTSYLERHQVDRGTRPPPTLLAGGGRVATGSQEAFDLFERSLSESVGRAAEAGAAVVLMAPLPELRRTPAAGLIAHPEGDALASRQELEELRRRTLAAMDRVADHWPGVVVWDPFDVLCPGERLDPWREGRLLYRDSNHLSVAGVDAVRSSLCDAIQRAAAAIQRRGSAAAKGDSAELPSAPR